MRVDPPLHDPIHAVSETAEQTHALHPVLDALFARIRAEAPAERGDALEAFAKAFVRRLSDEELEHHGADLLFSMVSSAFAFADQRGNEPSAVRVFVPTDADEGYGSVGTIVETNTDDSPFLVDSVSEELAARELRVRLLVHPVVGTVRDKRGRIERVLSGRGSGRSCTTCTSSSETSNRCRSGRGT